MDTLFFGKNFIEMAQMGSTQDFAAAILETHPPEGTVLFTPNQTAGRGQRDAVWHSLPGQNLAFSLILYPSFLSPQALFSLSKMTVLGILDTLRYFLFEPSLLVKWPNDVLLDGKKISGTLIETQVEGNRVKSAIIGIGMNVNQTEFGPDYGKAGSLAQFSGHPFSPKEILQVLLSHLEARYFQLKGGKLGQLDQEYLHNLYGYQEEIQVIVEGESRKAVLVGVDASGRLALEWEGKLRFFGIKEVAFSL